jgi:hypothetical protein
MSSVADFDLNCDCATRMACDLNLTLDTTTQ